MAQFKRLMVAAYGSCSAGYRALDKKNSKRLTQEQFVKGCKELGFSHGKTIFQAICHKPGVRVMIQHDIQFMDEWDPPEWLLEDPSEKDAFDFVQMMADRERDLVRAWRKILDKDGSNRVSWFEFKEAAKRLNFRGNTAGAWRYLDEDFGGYITLKEIDPMVHADLMEFKTFCHDEFGSVSDAFEVLDVDKSGDLTMN